MQIKGSGSKGVQDLTALRRYTPTKTRDDASKSEAASTPSATVELSAKARELESIRSQADRVPDVDEARVARIRSEIEAGTYKPDLGKVADGILQEAFWTTSDQI